MLLISIPLSCFINFMFTLPSFCATTLYSSPSITSVSHLSFILSLCIPPCFSTAIIVHLLDFFDLTIVTFFLPPLPPLSIELQVQEQPPAVRSGIYSHMEAFVPCNKEALLKRLKKLSLNIQVSDAYLWKN